MIEWEAPEFEYRPKGVSWYWASIVVAVLLIAIAAWQQNFLFGFFILVAEALVLVWANRTPTLHAFTLTEKGLHIGEKKFYAVTDLESYSTDEHWSVDWPSITLYFKRRFRPAARVHVPSERLLEIDQALKRMVPKIEHEETLIETIEHLIGF
jgi:hypothetical protein